MGCSYYTNLVIGIRLSDLNPVEVVKKSTVQRYNVITGEPYYLETSDTYTNLGTKEFKGGLREQLHNLGDEPDEDCAFGEYAPKCFYKNYIDKYANMKDVVKNAVIGYALESVSDYEAEVVQVDLEDQLHLKKTMLSSWLEETLGFTGELGIFMVMTVSC